MRVVVLACRLKPPKDDMSTREGFLASHSELKAAKSHVRSIQGFQAHFLHEPHLRMSSQALKKAREAMEQEQRHAASSIAAAKAAQ